MKKKIYLQPTTIEMFIGFDHHLCGTSDTKPNSDNPTQGLDDDPLTPGGDDPGEFSRKHRAWDDEEELDDDERGGW